MSSPSTGRFADLPAERPYRGVERRGFDSEHATVTSYRFEPEASFPLHRHPEEQITIVEAGELELTVAGEVTRMSAGDWSVVGSNVEHGITAGSEGARIIAIVTPRRNPSTPYSLVDRDETD